MPCYFTENKRPAGCRLLCDEADEMSRQLSVIRRFLTAYASESARTFVDRRNGRLIDATDDVRAFALACLEGPLSADVM